MPDKKKDVEELPQDEVTTTEENSDDTGSNPEKPRPKPPGAATEEKED